MMIKLLEIKSLSFGKEIFNGFQNWASQEGWSVEKKVWATRNKKKSSLHFIFQKWIVKNIYIFLATKKTTFYDKLYFSSNNTFIWIFNKFSVNCYRNRERGFRMFLNILFQVRKLFEQKTTTKKYDPYLCVLMYY